MRNRYVLAGCLMLVCACVPASLRGGESGEVSVEEDFADLRVELGRSGGFAAQPEQEGQDSAPVVALSAIRAVTELVPLSDNYTIDERVELDGYYYRFTVHSPHGEYQVLSLRRLLKLCREIEAIEYIRETDEGGHLMEGLGDSLVGLGEGVGNLVLHPGQSVRAVGAGAARFLRATGAFLTAPFRDEEEALADDGVDRSRAGRGLAGGERRRVAFELGLDVYTDNPRVVLVLNEIARLRFAGKLPVNIGLFVVPYGGVLPLSMTPVGTDVATEQLIRDYGPRELKRVLGELYAESFALSPAETATLERLLGNPNYSPREQAYIARHLQQLRALGGVGEAIAFLAEIRTPEQASVVSAQVELLAAMHLRGKPLAKLAPVLHTLGAVAEDGALVLVTSLDFIPYNEEVERSFQRALDVAGQENATRVEIWSTGEIDPATERMAKRMGVWIRPNALLLPVFRPSGEREGAE